jgi:putative endonuclease
MKRLVYYEGVSMARRRNTPRKQIKGYGRIKKLALIESLNQDWHDLAENWSANVDRPGPSLPSG